MYFSTQTFYLAVFFLLAFIITSQSIFFFFFVCTHRYIINICKYTNMIIITTTIISCNYITVCVCVQYIYYYFYALYIWWLRIDDKNDYDDDRAVRWQYFNDHAAYYICLRLMFSLCTYTRTAKYFFQIIVITYS